MFKRKKGDPYFKEASVAFGQEDWPRTVELCEKAIQEGIKNYDPALVYASYGYALTKVGREQDAIAMHKKSLEFNQQSPVAWRYYGMSLRQSNEFDGAERCYESALSIDHNDEYTIASLGALYIFRNKPQKAIEILEPFVEGGGQAAISMSNLALAYGMVGQFDAADEALGKAIQKGYTRWKHLQERLESMREFRKSLKLEDEKAWLPANCPKCGAPIHINSVQWISRRSALCGYCGSTIKQ